MKKIIIASHHELADGFKKTLEYIIPTIPFELIAISAYVNNTPIEKEIVDSIDFLSEDTEVIVFTDLLGGSVNQSFVKYLSNKNIHLITGVNLPIILSVVLGLTEDKICAENIQNSIQEAREQLVYVNDYLLQQIVDEDDE